MSSSRSSFVSGTIFGIVLGVLIGHIGIWSGTQTRSSSIVESFPVKEAALPGMAFDLGKKSENLPYFSEESLQPVDEYPEPEFIPPPEKHSPLANAIAMQTVQLKTVETTNQPAFVEIDTPAEEPQPLDIDDAAPLETHESKNDIALKKVIEEELTHIPVGQREVWFESLKDMHVDDAQGVIRMWKLIGGPIPGLGEDSLIQPPQEVKQPAADLNPPKEANSASATPAAIHAAMNIIGRNQIMASTPGYMRIIPRIEESVIDGKLIASGIIEEFDFSQGAPLLTNRIFDVMLQGPGFFEVKGEDGETYITRRGRFSLNDHRQLAIIDGKHEYTLQPPISIPEEATQVRIKMNGEVSFQEEVSESAGTTSRIRTVQILSPAKLSYFKNGMLKYDGEKLRADRDTTVQSVDIVQGVLEESNVNTTIEEQELQRFKGILKR